MILLIKFQHKGTLKKTEQYLKNARKQNYIPILEKYGRIGVQQLSSYTPVDTGKTSSSWGYEIVQTKNKISIHWTNSNINNGVPIAIIIQYGHGTGSGGYVEGVDYINPALKSIFEKVAEEIWREVIKG